MADSRLALLFDLDGTLVDSAPDIVAALNRLLVEYGRSPLEPESVKAMIGDGSRKLVERGFAASGGVPDDLGTLTQRFIELYMADVARDSRPYPGVVDTLTRFEAAGHRMAVCTNKLQSPTDSLLEALDLARFFAATAGGDRFAVRKPDGGHLLQTLALIGAAPEAAVMIGDSANDVNAARDAGIPVICVSYGYTRVPAHALGADEVVNRFDEIPDAVERIFAAR